MKLYEQYLHDKLTFHYMDYNYYAKNIKEIDKKIFNDEGFDKEHFNLNLSAAVYAIINNDLVGYYILRKRRNPKLCGIQSFAVIEKYRNKGFGRTILRHSFDEARKKGFKYMNLGVFTSEKHAIKLYQSEGFKIVGTIDDGTRHIMEKKL